MNKFVRVLIPSNENGTFLVLKEHRNGSVWNFPGGKVEKDESYKAACIREIYEETGLVIKKLQLLFKQDFGINGETWKGYYYLAKNVVGEMSLREAKSISFSYIGPEDFRKYNKAFMGAAQQAIISKWEEKANEQQQADT